MEIPGPLREKLRGTRRVAVLTGAGVSAESGVPTFRDAQTGLWARYSPEELATPAAFARNPKLVWEWYAWRRQLVAQAEPNAAHLALAALEQRFEQLTLVTQNVDGLHQRAGSSGVIELHGNISRIRCSNGCGVIGAFPAEESPPGCPHCGHHLRPDVVWFGELLPHEALERATRAASECDVFLSVGTSALVYPAAQLPLSALHAGAAVVEINPDETPLSRRASYVLQGTAGQVLPALVAALDAD